MNDDHRRDIDGLRAVAVLSIIFFHAGFRWCLGGFRGVDMFFVISGFLITGILLRENAAGTFTLAGFYERRARRILPALFVMLTVVLAVAYWVMLPSDLKLFGQNLTAIVLFSSNILFWRRAGGFDFYFEPSAQLNPLLHTWSLGVEEQFYLIFPLLILVGWKFWRRRLFQLVVLTAVVSFVYSSLIDGAWGLGFRAQREANFYLLPSRAWQLMLGAIVAFRAHTGTASAAPERRRELASGLGLAMVLYSMLVTSKADLDFPSIWALPATLGTAAILAYGRGTVVGRLLSTPPLVLIGLISYSAYLWHQPMFAFAHYVSLDDALTTGLKVGLCAASLVIAWVSWRVVEAPFRDRRRVSRRSIFAISAAGTATLLAGGVLFALVIKQPPTRGRLLASKSLLDSLTVNVLPATMKACASDAGGAGATDLGCAINDALSVPPSFLVVGDSHAGALLPAFRRMSEETGEQGRLVTMRGCPPLIGIYAELETDCLALQPAVLAYAQRAHISRVFLVARWASYTDGDQTGRFDIYLSQAGMPQTRTRETARQSVVDSLKRTVDAYAAAGLHVAIVSQVPEQRHRPLGMYLQGLMHRDPGAFVQEHSVTESQHRVHEAFVRETFATFASHPNVTLLDLSAVFCQAGICTAGTATQSYYWDKNHVSEAGALLLAGELRRQSAAHGQ